MKRSEAIDKLKYFMFNSIGYSEDQEKDVIKLVDNYLNFIEKELRMIPPAESFESAERCGCTICQVSGAGHYDNEWEKE